MRVLKIATSNYQLRRVSSVRMEQLVAHWTDFDKT
jgi:hypothetical protein